MDRPRLTRGLTAALAVVYLAAGVAETVRVIRSGDGGLWFWGGTLLGGSALLLAGLATMRRRPREARVAVCVGSLLGMLATAWSIVVPVLALSVIVLTVQDPPASASVRT